MAKQKLGNLDTYAPLPVRLLLRAGARIQGVYFCGACGAHRSIVAVTVVDADVVETFHYCGTCVWECRPDAQKVWYR